METDAADVKSVNEDAAGTDVVDAEETESDGWLATAGAPTQTNLTQTASVSQEPQTCDVVHRGMPSFCVPCCNCSSIILMQWVFWVTLSYTSVFCADACRIEAKRCWSYTIFWSRRHLIKQSIFVLLVFFFTLFIPHFQYFVSHGTSLKIIKQNDRYFSSAPQYHLEHYIQIVNFLFTFSFQQSLL